MLLLPTYECSYCPNHQVSQLDFDLDFLCYTLCLSFGFWGFYFSFQYLLHFDGTDSYTSQLLLYFIAQVAFHIHLILSHRDLVREIIFFSFKKWRGHFLSLSAWLRDNCAVYKHVFYLFYFGLNARQKWILLLRLNLMSELEWVREESIRVRAS